MFWQIDLCFGKLICVLETYLCFGKLICVLGNCYVLWETDLCFGKFYIVASLIVQVLLTETIKASKQFQGEAKYFVRPKAMALSRNSSVKTHAKM